MTAPGNSFNLTTAALADAQRRFDAAAAAVQSQFVRLEQAVCDNPSRGRAFTAAQRVAAELNNQAQQFQRLTEALAGSIGMSAKNYATNSEAGVQAMNSVMGGESATYNRLVRD